MVAVELVAEKSLGVRPEELWRKIDERRVKQIEAEYRSEFARSKHERELKEKNQEWIKEFGGRPLDGAVVVPEGSGRPVVIDDFKCLACGAPVLDKKSREKLVQSCFLGRGFSLGSKEELLDTITHELLDGNSSTYVKCEKCGNSTSWFRFMRSVLR